MLELLRIACGMQSKSEAKHLLSSSAVSSVCGWTETSTTAGATPVRHSGTPCSPKRRISSCRTSKSGPLSNRAVHRWGQKKVQPHANGRSPRPLEHWHRPKPDCTSPGLPRLKPAYQMLVHNYCSYYRAFLFFFYFAKNYLLCVSSYSLERCPRQERVKQRK